MRIIIAGSREGFTIIDVVSAMTKASRKWNLKKSEAIVVSGGARGVDSLGEIWATARGVPVERFPANWEKFGKSAGFRRNLEMASVADALVALWDGKSKGTAHMINTAIKLNIKVLVMGHNQQELYPSD